LRSPTPLPAAVFVPDHRGGQPWLLTSLLGNTGNPD
jgi:hypothetical protein